MLTLQRASAGSGKTYSLARTYLRQLLSFRDDNTGTVRLRTPKEVRGAHSHLLAITFTNRATAEMRKRFIDSLALLAHADNPPLDKNGNPVTIDYLADFRKEFSATDTEIAATARALLSEILNHYSDFQVSTIDSFFQQILRSFAYEAELPDSYEVEIDSERLVNLALDSIFLTARSEPDSDEAFWVDHYTSQLLGKGNKWNLTQRNGGPRRTLVDFLNMMDSEDFKQQRDAIDKYFKDTPPATLRQLPGAIDKLRLPYLQTVHQKAVDATHAFMQAAEAAGVANNLSKDQAGRIDKVRAAKPDKYPFSPTTTRYKNPLVKAGYSKLGENEYNRIKALSDDIADAMDSWKGAGAYFDKVREAVPVVMLVHLLQKHLAQYRTDNNLVQLSDTNTILRAITADSDVPFIYEKIGTRLDSYMIDEFQDTSRLQWENMRPLVDESMGRGNDNLIIGDAKQSIYRFRNADSTLITSGVPAQYAGPRLRTCGDKVNENANWRSAPEIVRFNNSLFTYLASTLHVPGAVADIAATYSGICQQPQQTKLRGYVELRSFVTDKKDADDSATDMPCLVPCIDTLIARGYHPRDIAVLVRTRAEGRTAVRLILDAQADKNANDRIDVISDESLLIASAASVEIITTLLQAVKNDNVQSADTAISGGSYSRRMDDFTGAMHRMRSNGEGLSAEERMELYFACQTPKSNIRQLVADSPSMALPALVERIIGSDMIPESMRRQEAAYISAFQDAVATFSERNQPDVASFLLWWDDNKDSLTITSPEDADAVQVLTIHKAKGLEWRCVIIPSLTFDLKINGNREKDWLPVEEPFKQKAILPPLLPVRLNSRETFEHTPWQQAYDDIEAKNHLDILNLAYVACTRAADELYIFMKEKNTPKDGPADIRDYLLSLRDNADWLPDCDFGMEPAGLLLDTASAGKGGLVLSYGQPPSAEHIAARTRKLDEKRKNGQCESRPLDDYYVNMDIPKINYRVSDLPPHETESASRHAIRLGNVEHAILEGIRPGHDPIAEADRLLRRALIRGYLTRAEHNDMTEELHALLACGQAREWFGPDVKVFAERTLKADITGQDRRPDRIVVDADNIATVIDYKTGDRRPAKHRDQVREYITRLRATSLFADVRGVLWYLKDRENPFDWVSD